MKRIFAALLLCLLAVPALASPETGLAIDLGPEGSRGSLTAPDTPGDARLLAEIHGADLPGEHVVRVTYLVQDRAVHVETIRFRVTGGGDGLVDLLVWSDTRREAFIQGFGERSVLLEHPDGSRETLRLERLLFDTSRWSAEGRSVAEPLVVASPPSAELTRQRREDGVQAIFAASTCDQQCCNNECDSRLDLCEDRCGPGAAEDCLLWCEAQWQDCRTDCQSCPEVTEWSETVFVSDTFIGGSLCLEDHLFPWEQPKEYFRHERTFKTTTYRRTIACDGSITTEVIDVQFFTDICTKRTEVTCFFVDPGSACQY